MPRNKHKRNRECVAVVHWLFHWVVAPKAWFKRRTLHVPNLIIKFGACEVRRMNQLGLTVFYLGRSALLFDWACPIERQKIDFDSYVDLYMCRTKCIHYAYIMHTLCIHYINNFFPQSRLFLRCCHAQKTKFEKMAGIEEQCCSSCFNNTKYTCLRCQEYFCIPLWKQGFAFTIERTDRDNS